MRTGVPCNENRFFPVRIYYTGKTMFWPCSGGSSVAGKMAFMINSGEYSIQTSNIERCKPQTKSLIDWAKESTVWMR